MRLPFRDFTARDVQDARDLVRELGRRLRARLARRERRARRGRLDFRRTIRASMSSGGVPARPRFRARRPARPDLVALCDLSGSVAAASELMLGLVAPAADWFRRTHLFAYVDRLCPVSIEDGHVAPGGPLDLHARSDFGRVLDELWRERRDLLTRATLLLVAPSASASRAWSGSSPSPAAAGTRATASSRATPRCATRCSSASTWPLSSRPCGAPSEPLECAAHDGDDRAARRAPPRGDEEVRLPVRRDRDGGLPAQLRRAVPRLREPLPARADEPRLGGEPVLHRGQALRAVR
ncbi:MAG: VWA domain-containing protein, partial [Deltaproteobacteria bacterium]